MVCLQKPTHWNGYPVKNVTPLYTHPAPSGQAVAVKALEWVEHETNWWSADPKGLGFGYAVRLTDRGTTRIRMPAQHWDIFEGTVAEAKAAAQADYDRRILSALSNPPAQPGWRLIERGETIDADDEAIADDGVSWVKVDRWAVGAHYSGIFKSIRRATPAAPLPGGAA
jgi:hypothetical protein